MYIGCTVVYEIRYSYMFIVIHICVVRHFDDYLWDVILTGFLLGLVLASGLSTIF